MLEICTNKLSQSVEVLDAINKYDIICLESGVATEKSTLMAELSFKVRKVVSLYNRRSNERKGRHDMKMETYRGKTAYDLANIDRVSIVVNSLNNAIDITNIDLLLIDEITSLYDTIFNESTISNHARIDIIEILNTLISRSKKVIFASADVTESEFKKMLKLYELLGLENKSSIYIKNNWCSNNKHLNYYETGASQYKIVYFVMAYIEDMLMGNKKLYVFCDTKKNSNAISDYFTALKYKCLVINRDTRDMLEQKEFLSDPDKSIVENQWDVIVVSPSVCTGISLESAYITDVIVCLTKFIIEHKTVLQALNRVRCVHGDGLIPIHLFIVKFAKLMGKSLRDSSSLKSLIKTEKLTGDTYSEFNEFGKIIRWKEQRCKDKFDYDAYLDYAVDVQVQKNNSFYQYRFNILNELNYKTWDVLRPSDIINEKVIDIADEVKGINKINKKKRLDMMKSANINHDYIKLLLIKQKQADETLTQLEEMSILIYTRAEELNLPFVSDEIITSLALNNKLVLNDELMGAVQIMKEAIRVGSKLTSDNEESSEVSLLKELKKEKYIELRGVMIMLDMANEINDIEKCTISKLDEIIKKFKEVDICKIFKLNKSTCTTSYAKLNYYLKKILGIKLESKRVTKKKTIVYVFKTSSMLRIVMNLICAEFYQFEVRKRDDKFCTKFYSELIARNSFTSDILDSHQFVFKSKVHKYNIDEDGLVVSAYNKFSA